MFLFASTIFTSAFLLFLVQPMIAKKILPWFGGSAAVWTTCMLFFQFVLLLGYLYSHWSIRCLKPKRQALVHLGLLVASLLVLPLAPNSNWRISGDQDPALHILALLALSVGLPYFLISTTGPLLQAWYARRYQGAVPYRLYALSNLASMLALIGYPTLMEPFVGTRIQLLIWSAAYVLFAALCGAVAWSTRKTEAAAPAEGTGEAVGEAPKPATQALWVLLAACSSAMLLALTNYLCQDVAAMPFLWVLPLALYLLSFVICFDHERWYKRVVFGPLLAISLGVMAYGIFDSDSRFGLRIAIPVLATGLFVCCMFCHGELVARKPSAVYLTKFYLMISFGGALGALFVALAAPRIFNAFYELPISLALCGVLAVVVSSNGWKLRAAWAVFALVLIGYLGYELRPSGEKNRVQVRNFYGGLKVYDDTDSDFGPERKLLHGAINHGLQLTTAKYRRTPTTYYAPKSGAGLAILNTRREGQRLGVIGLGTGTLAAYTRPGDFIRFYEINPQVLMLARTQFTYLSDSPAKVDVVLGDARLSLEREASQQFDVLAVDAFSGDSIPVHLLTREAFELYFRHLRPGGVLAVHVSNRYLDLEPVVKELADKLHKNAALFETEDGEYEMFESSWVLVSDNQAFWELPEIKPAAEKIERQRNLKEWTDDYSNLFQIVRWTN